MTAGTSERGCAVEGCDRARYGRGLCRAHHHRWRRSGDPGTAEIRTHQRGALCTVAGCEQPHAARGWCATHYSRWRRTGDPHSADPPVPPALDIAACARIYRDGASATGLARLYGLTPAVILTALRAAGVPIRPGGPRRHRPRPTADTTHERSTPRNAPHHDTTPAPKPSHTVSTSHHPKEPRTTSATKNRTP